MRAADLVFVQSFDGTLESTVHKSSDAALVATCTRSAVSAVIVGEAEQA